MSKRSALCSVNGCLNGRGNNLSFFRFPKQLKRCAEWVKLINRPDLEEILKEEGPDILYKNYVICSAHFKAEDFRNINVLSQGLLNTAVPSIFYDHNVFVDGKETNVKEDVIEEFCGNIEGEIIYEPVEEEFIDINDQSLRLVIKDVFHVEKKRSTADLKGRNSAIKHIGQRDEKLDTTPVAVLDSELNSSLAQSAETPCAKRRRTDNGTHCAAKNIKIPNSLWFSKNLEGESGEKILTSSIPIDNTKTTRHIQDLTADKLCRICGRFDKSSLQSIYSELSKSRRIPYVINKYLPIMISKDEEKLPMGICLMCFSYLVDWQCLIERCQATDEWLHKIFNVPRTITNVTPLKSATPDIDNVKEENQVINIIKQYNKKKNTLTDKDHDYCTNSDTSKRNNTINDSSVSNNVDNEESMTEFPSESLPESVNDNDDDDILPKRKPRYKVFSVCVCDNAVSELDGNTENVDNIVIEDDSMFAKSEDIHTITVGNSADEKEDTGGNDSVECSQISMDENSTNINQDEDSRDTLSLASGEFLFNSCETDSGVKSELNNHVVNPRNSSDRFIAKQRYKVSITIVKRNKQDIVRSQPRTPKRRNQIDVNTVDRVSIAITKHNKTHKYSINPSKYNMDGYAKVSSFSCELCNSFPMTANEFGKHMKSFHSAHPYKCPVCEMSFKEDYNLIIHLQVTACSRSIASNAKEIGKSDEQLPETDVESSSSLSHEADLCACFKLTHKTSEFDNANDDSDETGTFNIEYIDSNDDILLKVNCKDHHFHEITVDTWEPSTTSVVFEPGFVILDTMQYFDFELGTMIISEIKKLLNMESLSAFDCNALRMIMGTKVNDIVNTVGNDKVIKIKSVSSQSVENKDDANSEPISDKSPVKQKGLQKKVFKPVKKFIKGRPTIRDLYSGAVGRKKKTVKRIVQAQDPVACDECGKKYSSHKTVWRHKKLWHMEVKCDHCDQLLASVKALRKHKRDHARENLLNCNDCSLKFYKKDSLKKHNLLVHNIGEFVHCNICDKKFVSKMSLYSHKKNVHSTQMTLCPQCGHMYKTPAALRCHIRDRHMNLTKKFECSVCKKSFKTSTKLKAHSLRHSERREIFACDLCNKKFYSKDAVRRHHQEVHSETPSVFCAICKAAYHRSSRLPVHLKSVHWTTVNRKGSEQFPCLLCGVMLEDGESLSQHMMFHSEDDKVKEVRGEDIGRNKCSDCGKYLRSKKDVALHMFYVHEDQPFRCSFGKECEQKFWSKAALDEHEAGVHQHDTSNICHFCNQVFSNIKKKETHIRKTHAEELAPHICMVCDKSFRSAYTLNRHSVTHSDVKQYQCSICDRCFSLPQILAKHMLWHQRQAQKSRDANANAMEVDVYTTEEQYQIGDYNEARGEDGVDYEEIQEDGDHHPLEFVDSELIVPDDDINNVEIVSTPVVVGEVVSVCTVYKCTQCNILFNRKTEFDEHCSDYHNVHKELIDNYESSEVLEVSVVQSDM